MRTNLINKCEVMRVLNYSAASKMPLHIKAIVSKYEKLIKTELEQFKLKKNENN